MRIVSALIKQVTDAVPDGGSVKNVTTIITIDLFVEWNSELQSLDAGGKVLLVLGPNGFNSIFGSKTVVLDTPGMWSCSFPSHLEEFLA